MAIITSAKTGLFSDPTVWVGGIVPVLGDSVIIARTGTGLETFSTDATGYAIGATAITLTGTVLAGSFIIGEAVQFGSTNNSYYTITNWNSATKVLTVTALVVAIPAAATLVKSRGHVVTVAGTFHVGDDTITAFQVNGTLLASRTASSALTVRGLIQTALTEVATIDYGRKALSNPIPAGFTARLILNSSAAMVNHKYGIFIADTSNGFFCGANKKRHSTITANIAAAATSAVVADATGWVVNDWVVFAATNGTATNYDRRQIVTITAGAGTTATITFAAVTFAHVLGCPIGNFTSNVQIESFNTTNPAYVCFRHSTTVSNNRREIDSISFENCGGNTSLTLTQVFVAGTTASMCTPFVSLSNFSQYNGNNSVGLFFSSFITSASFKLTGSVFHTDNGSGGSHSYPASGTTLGLDDCLFIYSVGAIIAHGFSQGPQGVIYSNCKFWGSGSAWLAQTNGDGVQFNDCQFSNVAATSQAGLFTQSGSMTFNRCFIASSQVAGTTRMQFVIDGSTVIGSVGNHVFNDCRFGTPITDFANRLSNGNQLWRCAVNNKNADVLQNEYYTSLSSYYQDNAVINRSKSSMRVHCDTSSTATHTFTFLAVSGTAYTIKGFLRKNVSYGAATLPSVTISGLGITPVVFTMTNSVDIWEAFSLTATQVSGATGNLTVTLTTQSASTAGRVYLDGLPISPFVTFARHYGSLFNTASATTTVDTIIQQTNEVTVGAYTGISIAGSTITLTGNKTIREVYDFCKRYLCQTANLNVADFFTSTDGVNFASTYNLTLSGGNLTGTGNLSLGSATLTRTVETSTLPITYNSGAAVFGNVTISGLVANSHVRLNNTTDNLQLYNAVVAGTSVTVPATWTANKTLDLRVTNVIGLTAYLPFQSAGTLTSTLASFTASQALDTVYNANAINGSTVTEYIADYPNIQVDINDADGATTVARLYAWFQFSTHSSQGIISYFRGIIAGDQFNYEIKVSIVDLVLDNISATSLPIKISGAYLYRDNGTTVIFSGSKSVQLDPGKAFLANHTNSLGVINRNVQKASLLIPATEEVV